MTATREAIVLPALFLTAALLGGLRVNTRIVLLPPPLVALVLGVLLVGALVRGGVLVPGRLVNADRGALANANGATVILTLLAASAQIFNLITPDTGLLHLLFTAFFFMQVLTMAAGTSGPRQILRSVGVLLGCALLLRFVILENLYAPGTGTAKRVLTLLVEGVSLGAIDYEPHAAATGYVALLAVALYLVAVWLLATSPVQPSRAIAIVPQRHDTLTILLLVFATAAACGGGEGDAPTSLGEAKASAGVKGTVADADRAVRARDEALRAARVWAPPPIAPAKANLAENPPGQDALPTDAEITCRFVPKKVGGTTPKFNCELPGGDVVRIKYGSGNAELRAEVGATRLLAALGFGADRMFVVRRVRCLGCPQFPFQALKCLDDNRLSASCFAGAINYSEWVDFDPAIVERRFEGKKIEAVEDQGWAWYELDRIDPAHGGSTRAEVDGLRLIALLLAHWDNKAENQRLVCLPAGERPDGTCAKPFALIQDLGGTFGPFKVDLANWQRAPIWTDPRSCRVSMKHLPWGGGTFPDGHITEAGRRFALSLLDQLSERQLAELFDGSRMTAYDQVSAAGRDAALWVKAFKNKVSEIRAAGPCAD